MNTQIQAIHFKADKKLIEFNEKNSKLYENGVLRASGNIGSNLLLNYSLGCNINSLSQFEGAKFYELLIFDSNFDQNNSEDLENFI